MAPEMQFIRNDQTRHNDPETHPEYTTINPTSSIKDTEVAQSIPLEEYPSNEQTLITFPFYEEIKQIWEKNGRKRHEVAPKPEQKNPVTQQDFSFSPYDNFF